MSKAPVIVGAGLAGLIAAHAWPNATIFEASPEPVEKHKALLRFRNDSVSRLIGIEFKPVLVRKGVWAHGTFCAPSIQLANAYAMKCLGRIVGDRSIWNLDAAQRFIAPDNLYEQLVDNVRGRARWGEAFDYAAASTQVISTAPMPVVLNALGVAKLTGLSFNMEPICVVRADVEACDAYQTVYFPESATTLYRASITGSKLIAEFAGEPDGVWLSFVERAFSISRMQLHNETTVHRQRYGKISPIDNDARKAILFKLTNEHNIFSLGRFATWRNILLDDVVDDIAVLKRLMRRGSYELLKDM